MQIECCFLAYTYSQLDCFPRFYCVDVTLRSCLLKAGILGRIHAHRNLACSYEISCSFVACHGINRWCSVGLCFHKEMKDIPELYLPAALAWSVTKFGVVLDRCSLFLDDDDAYQMVDYGTFFVQLYLFLACQALRMNRARWKARPKFHSLACEIIQRVARGSRFNPRFLSCGGDEDFIGKVCGCIKGKLHASTFGRRVLQRALLGLNVYLMKLGSS